MAYPHHKVEQSLGTGVVTSAAAIGTPFHPGLQKFVVRAFALVLTAAITGSDAIVELRKRITPGSDTGAVAVGTITLPLTGTAIGQVYYKRGFNVSIQPGDELIMVVTDVATAGTVFGKVELDPQPEVPGNLGAEMIASA
jgi:hypothetical protein